MKATFNEINNRYECEFTNNKGEKIEVWIFKTHHGTKGKSCLMTTWLECGYVEKFMPETWYIETYVYDSVGNCKGLYNPLIKPHNNKINFDWVLEATTENLTKIIKEVERLANQ